MSRARINVGVLTPRHAAASGSGCRGRSSVAVGRLADRGDRGLSEGIGRGQQRTDRSDCRAARLIRAGSWSRTASARAAIDGAQLAVGGRRPRSTGRCYRSPKRTVSCSASIVIAC